MTLAVTDEAQRNMIRDALESARSFIDSVTTWTGHEDDISDVLSEIDEAVEVLENTDKRTGS